MLKQDISLGDTDMAPSLLFFLRLSKGKVPLLPLNRLFAWEVVRLQERFGNNSKGEGALRRLLFFVPFKAVLPGIGTLFFPLEEGRRIGQ